MMTHTGGATVPSITRFKKIFKNDYTVPHSTTFVLCYTVFFLSCTSVCKLYRTRKIVRNSINTRKRDTFVFLFVWNSASGDTSNRRKPQSHDDKVTAVLMGQ